MNPGFSPDQRCLIGVSGGRDSVVLLHRLLAAGFLDLIVCHLDHGLRTESADDARFVAELAAAHGLPAVIERQDIAARAKGQRQSLETAGREARYDLFARASQEHGPRLFLAHHADDQVETFLLHLFRGAAMNGLAAMRPLSAQTIRGVTLEICRPLLGMWREEIDAYVAEHRLAFREDTSNTDPRFTRNRVRKELLPAIEQSFGRDIRPAIWRTAELLRAEDEFLDSLLSPQDLEPRLSVIALRAQPLALQRRTLHRWLRAQSVPLIGFAEVEAVRALLSTRAAKCNLPGGWHARRREKQLFLEGPT